jgi:hypothetical protein
VVIVLQPVENNNKIVFNAPKYNLEWKYNYAYFVF